MTASEPAATEPTAEGAPAEGAPADSGRDAARYRRQLRETETERDALGVRLESLQRNEIARLAAAERLAQPASIWANGATMADFLDDAGDVDPGKVTAVAQTAIRALGLELTPGPPVIEGGPRKSWPPQTSWSDLLNVNR